MVERSSETSPSFPDEAMRLLARVVTVFDLGLIVLGVVCVALDRVAGGLAVIALGAFALCAVSVLRPRQRRA